jgi:competence protein ComFC
MGLGEWLFPKRCVGCGRWGDYFCSGCVESLPLVVYQICPNCGQTAMRGKTHQRCLRRWGLDGLVSGFFYQGVMLKAIKELKYRYVRDLREDLAALVVRRIPAETKGWFRREKLVVVPIPLHPQKERERGFNQARLLAEELAEQLGLEWRQVLERKRKTKSQAEMKIELRAEEKRQIRRKYQLRAEWQRAKRQWLARKKLAERRENVRGAFRVDSAGVEDMDIRKVLLVDDVWTTGATMQEVGKVLKQAGVKKVWGLTVARSGRCAYAKMAARRDGKI